MNHTLYCGIEDEVFFLRNSFSDKFKKRKARTIPLSDIIQKVNNNIKTPKGGVTSFWNEFGGLVYAESGATEVTTPLIEQRRGCVSDLLHSTLAQRSVLIQMKDEFEKHTPVSIQGYSSHYNITVDSDLLGNDLNSINKHPQAGSVDDYWPKFTTDIIETMIKTVGPAYFALLEDDVSSGFMYRVRKRNRFELCGDFMPDCPQLGSGLAFLLGSLRGIERKIKEKIVENSQESDLLSVYDKVSPEEILSSFPLVLDEVSYRRITSKEGLGSDRSFIKKMKHNGTKARLSTTTGMIVTPLEILQEYFEMFKEDISFYAGGGEADFLQLIGQGEIKLHIDTPGHVDFYKDVSRDYIKEHFGKTDDEFLEEHVPQRGVAEVVSSFVRQESQIFGDIKVRAKRFTWDEYDFDITTEDRIKKVTVPVDSVYQFYSLLSDNRIEQALSLCGEKNE